MKVFRRFVLSYFCVISINTLPAADKPLIHVPRFDGKPLIHVLIPRFDGDPAIGAPVATVLNLQLWCTLERSPEVKGVTFSGQISWTPGTLREQSHALAEAVAQKYDIRAQMILWGKAWRFGDGVVTQTYLSIPNYQDLRPIWPERWYIKFKVGKITAEWELDIPTRRYEFPSIALRRELVSEFQEIGGLELYRDRELKQPLRKLEATGFTACEHAGDRSKITLDNNETGWVYLPTLSDKKSYIIDFVGGLIRIFRGDYAGAQELLRSVARAEDATQQLKLDSTLYLAFAADQLNNDPLVYTQAALQLNPYSDAAVRYHLTAQCSVFARDRLSGKPVDTQTFLNGLRTTVRDYGYLLAPDDPTLRSVKALIAEQ